KKSPPGGGISPDFSSKEPEESLSVFPGLCWKIHGVRRLLVGNALRRFVTCFSVSGNVFVCLLPFSSSESF
ncbi:hypothetical protein ACWARJ_005614, partial [Escherichia coli]